MTALPLSFRWPAEFVARIDEARGLVPRSAFVRAAVEEALTGPAADRVRERGAKASPVPPAKPASAKPAARPFREPRPPRPKGTTPKRRAR